MSGLILSHVPAADLPVTATVHSIAFSDDHVHLEIESLDQQLRSIDLDLLAEQGDEGPGASQTFSPEERPLAAVLTLEAGVLHCSVLQRGVGSSPVEVGLPTVRDLQEQGVRTVLRVVAGGQDSERRGS